MANDVKWTDWRSSECNGHPSSIGAIGARSAMLQLLGCLVGLLALAVVLPRPDSWAGQLSAVATGTPGPEAIGATAETAILVAASVLVWALLGWVLVVWFAAVVGRLPGAPGRCGRLLLRTIAPAAAGRLIAAAVGVSLLAGTSACAVPAMADLGTGSTLTGASDSRASSTSATPVPTGGGTGVANPASTAPPTAPTTAANTTTNDPTSPDGVIGSITIDWPAAVTPGSTTAPVAATPPIVTSAPETTPADAPTADTSPTGTSPTDTVPGGSPDQPTTAAADPPSPPEATSAADQESSTAAPAAEPAGPTPINAAAPPANTPSGETTPNAATEVPANPEPGKSATPSPAANVAAAGVEVLAGDTLWSIAHHHLTADATDEQIDTAWRTWYSANTQVIGANPDLIQPGQLLLPPDPEMGR